MRGEPNGPVCPRKGDACGNSLRARACLWPERCKPIFDFLRLKNYVTINISEITSLTLEKTNLSVFN